MKFGGRSQTIALSLQYLLLAMFFRLEIHFQILQSSWSPPPTSALPASQRLCRGNRCLGLRFAISLHSCTYVTKVSLNSCHKWSHSLLSSTMIIPDVFPCRFGSHQFCLCNFCVALLYVNVLPLSHLAFVNGLGRCVVFH
jgi:hypothetical protein